ncbi:putative L-galactonate transporter [bacterium HR39]|nr:putative L-galactonate transporter [bacterium HR39]
MATADTRGIAERRGEDALVIGLITLGHFFAHFYIIALPPLFPVLAAALDVGYTELGVAVAVLNLLTAVTQAPVGVLVDRYGPAKILIAGQAAFALAMVGIGLFPSYPVLLLMCALAGLGNAVYHPADYAILAARVSEARMGRAFSFHTFGGYAGFAAAPPVLVALDALWGWRAALVAVGLVGLAVAVLMAFARRHLHVEPHPEAPRREGGSRAAIALFLSRPVLLAFLFITFYATAHVGLNNFTVAFLERRYGFDLATANVPLTVFLVLSATGVLAGGWIADSLRRHELVVAGCLLLTALVAVLVAEFAFALPTLVLLYAVSGFAMGVVAPSRDMLVRNVAPPGTVGRVFGFVTTGFNVAGLAGPPVFGLVLDFGHPALVMWLAALFCVITLPTVLSASAAGRPAAARTR